MAMLLDGLSLKEVDVLDRRYSIRDIRDSASSSSGRTGWTREPTHPARTRKTIPEDLRMSGARSSDAAPPGSRKEEVISLEHVVLREMLMPLREERPHLAYDLESLPKARSRDGRSSPEEQFLTINSWSPWSPARSLRARGALRPGEE